MSDAIDQIKNIGEESANNFITLVKSNPKASIAIGVVVVVLLIICVYLRRRCSKDSIIVSRRQYKQLLKRMKEEEMVEHSRSLRPSVSNLSPEQMQLKRLREKDEERQALYLKQRQQKEAINHTEKVEKHFPVAVPEISLNTTHETEVSNDSSSDYDIESAHEESIEVALDKSGRDNILESDIDHSSIFELSNFEKDMYASDRSEEEDRMHHRKKWFQSRPKKK
jgi:hypothetical protein